MNSAGLSVCLTLATFTLTSRASAQDGANQSDNPVLLAIQQQNAILEQRLKLATQERNLTRLASPREDSLARLGLDASLQAKDDTTIEGIRSAYLSLAGLAPEVAKALACSGNNVVLYGPAQSDALFSLRAFNDQVELLRSRLRPILELQTPTPPDKDTTTGVYGVSALTSPVLQSVLDLIALFRHAAEPASNLTADDNGLTAIIANAAIAQGCVVFWPEQYGSNPFNPASQVMANLQSLAELNDNSGKAGKPAGLQQRVQALRLELKRSEGMIQARTDTIEKEQFKLTEATKKVDAIKAQITFLTSNIKDQKNASLQEKLNKAFDKSWDELDQAVRRQLGSGLPGTIEEQGKLGEMSKRLDLLKGRTDWLSQYVRDEKDLALQDRLKRTLSGTWDQLDAALKNLQALTMSVPQAIEPEEKEKRRWEKYTAELKELVTTLTVASEAYTTFRGALLDGSSGPAPLTRMLRAEAIRDLIFDDKFQERAGSSIVQLRLQKLTGTHLAKIGTDEKKAFSGGVVLSFVQYEPNGKVEKNSGVHTAYIPLK